jgi:hypothetical protein
MKTRTYEIILNEEEDSFIDSECDRRDIVNSLDLVSFIVKDWILKTKTQQFLLDELAQDAQDMGFYE